MKLKSLELSGFKSFLEKTVIGFPSGISAIVGPNGCGKSNIVDALRWVMGEQSVKQLRGKSMEDVIFSGTHGKPPLNMAEVSLTILNNNGTVPEEFRDYSEIMVTRRLYRSGESAYFINKQPCRLKDVHSLFMGSGMGAKTYAVIQQGNIGVITDASPDERRLFVEEAAGVTRYKNRKNEALRKVFATNQNLLRVADIIVEVKRQMNSLKRQVKTAERYRKYQDQIRILDVILSLYQSDDYTRQIEKTNALLNDQKELDLEQTTKLKRLDAAVEDIKLQRWKKNQEISEKKSHRFEIQRKMDKAENDLAHLRKEIERLGNETRELEDAHGNMEEKNREMMLEIAQVEKQHAHLNGEIESIHTRLSSEQKASATLKEELSELQQLLEGKKSNLMKQVAQEARYKNIYQNAAHNRESLQRRLKKAAEEEAIAQKTVNEVQQKEVGAREKLTIIREEIEELEQNIGGVKATLAEKSNALGTQVKHVHTLELERNKAQSNFTALKKMEENYEWYREGVKAIMKQRFHPGASENSENKSPHSSNNGILGLMVDIIEPDPSFETAVEAVLGESLQYILVKDIETGVDCIEYLQTSGAGRSGFIPVPSIRQLEKNAQGNPHSAAPLLNYVSVKPGFEEISQMLLGHVVVADHLTEALEIHGKNGRWQTIVTKGGDIVSPQGILIGGSKEKLSGILAKKQEIRELEGQIIELNQDLASAQENQKRLEAQVYEIESNLQKLIAHRSEIAENEIEIEKDLYKASEELKHARRHLDIVRLEQEQLLGEESDLDDEITEYAGVLEKIKREVEVAQEDVTANTQKIESLSTEMDDFNQRIVELKLAMTSLNAKIENSNNTLRRLQEFKNDGTHRLKQLSNEIIQKKQRRDESKREVTEHEQMLSQMYHHLQQLDEELASNEADYQTIDDCLTKNDNIINDIKSKREETLQNIRLLELEQSERNIKLENIINRLRERYHRPPSELRNESSQYLEENPDMQQLSPEEIEAELANYRARIANIGDVNLGAIREYDELKTRFDFLNEQHDDLTKALDDLHKVIKKINKISQKRFLETFDQVNEKLEEVFPRLFEGGTAKLVLTEPDKPLETGVEFMIHPPGKKLTRMSLLSGGEKALSAIALIFSIFLIKPASFCLMDEIDAPLDDANIFRFNDLLKIIGENSQIIMVTHNKRSMEFADTLFGITMATKGISKVVSVNLNKAEASN
ncbi:chromosome segregation protein SMC [Thermodesulfobacteriota bacterium]